MRCNGVTDPDSTSVLRAPQPYDSLNEVLALTSMISPWIMVADKAIPTNAESSENKD